MTPAGSQQLRAQDSAPVGRCGTKGENSKVHQGREVLRDEYGNEFQDRDGGGERERERERGREYRGGLRGERAWGLTKSYERWVGTRERGGDDSE